MEKQSLKAKMTGAYVVLVVCCLAAYLYTLDFKQLSALHVRATPLLFASAIALGFRYWGVFVWCRILKDLGVAALPRFKVMAFIYAKAWLGRYVPGKVTWIAGKVWLASHVGISKKRLTISAVLEAGIQVIALLVLSLGLLSVDDRFRVIPRDLRLLMVGLAVAGVVALVPIVFNRTVVVALRTIKPSLLEGREDLGTNWKAVLNALWRYVMGFFVSGTSYYLFTTAVYPLAGGNYLFLLATFNIAGAIGMVAVFAPSGIGVREGVQLLLLPLIMPLEAAVAVSVIARLWSTIIDLLFVAVSYGVKRADRSITAVAEDA